MATEESEKSMVTMAEEAAENKATAEEEEEEVEKGEIVDQDAANENPGKTLGATHPLEHSWTFWFDNPSAKSKQQAWGSSIRPIYTFSTVEQFWSLYNNIHHPSKLGVGADFHCFKHKIEPKWEDPVCAYGGKWTVTFSKGKSDTCWLYTLLAMVGEQFDHGDEICGAVVNVRNRQEKIAIWTRNAANEAAQGLIDAHKLPTVVVSSFPERPDLGIWDVSTPKSTFKPRRVVVFRPRSRIRLSLHPRPPSNFSLALDGSGRSSWITMTQLVSFFMTMPRNRKGVPRTVTLVEGVLKSDVNVMVPFGLMETIDVLMIGILWSNFWCHVVDSNS